MRIESRKAERSFNMKLKEEIYIDVKNCARCGKNHPGLGFVKFERNIKANKNPFSHWSKCPRTWEPVLMKII